MKTVSTPFQPAPNNRHPARPLFAVGDVHGCDDALAALLQHVGGVIERRYVGRAVDLVYLGDYVDRGPDPLGVLRRVNAGLGIERVREIALMGNHDRFLLQAARIDGRSMDFTDWAIWLSNGGRETLAGLGGLGYSDATPERLRDALGADLVDFLGTLQLNFRSGEIYCAHAGVDPDVALERQTEQALLWIREPFLSVAARGDGGWPFDVAVVHGHTIGAHGVFANRVGVDTGGYATGVFSVAEFCDEGVRLHHVTRDGG